MDNWKTQVFAKVSTDANIKELGDCLLMSLRKSFRENDLGIQRVNFLPQQFTKVSKTVGDSSASFIINPSHQGQVICKKDVRYSMAFGINFYGVPIGTIYFMIYMPKQHFHTKDGYVRRYRVTLTDASSKLEVVGVSVIDKDNNVTRGYAIHNQSG